MKLNTGVLYLSIVLGLMLAGGVWAQTEDTSPAAVASNNAAVGSDVAGDTTAVSSGDSTTAVPGTNVVPLRERAKTRIDSRLDNIGQKRDELRQKAEERRAELKEKAQEKRTELRQKVDERRTELQEKRQELVKKMETKRAQRILAFVKQMLARFEAAIKRLENLAERIASRLDKFAAGGKDVSNFRARLAAANAKIESARALISSTRSGFEAVTTSETPQTQFGEAKAKLNEIKTAIKEAHAALVGVVNFIKGASVGPSGTPQPASPETTSASQPSSQ